LTIHFSHHALEKARKRGVKRSHIDQTLRVPDELYEDVEHGTMIAVKRINDRSIILAYREEDGIVKIITIYYTTKLGRLIQSKRVRGAWRRVK